MDCFGIRFKIFFCILNQNRGAIDSYEMEIIYNESDDVIIVCVYPDGSIRTTTGQSIVACNDDLNAMRG